MSVKSSIEGEILGSHSGMSVVLRIRKFIEAQGYMIEHKCLYHDNNITILMDTNGRELISKTTKHVKS